MKELYQWLQDLAVYLILVSAILQALPQESYQKIYPVLFRTGTDHSSDDSTVKADRYGGQF